MAQKITNITISFGLDQAHTTFGKYEIANVLNGVARDIQTDDLGGFVINMGKEAIGYFNYHSDDTEALQFPDTEQSRFKMNLVSYVDDIDPVDFMVMIYSVANTIRIRDEQQGVKVAMGITAMWSWA